MKRYILDAFYDILEYFEEIEYSFREDIMMTIYNKYIETRPFNDIVLQDGYNIYDIENELFIIYETLWSIAYYRASKKKLKNILERYTKILISKYKK